MVKKIHFIPDPAVCSVAIDVVVKDGVIEEVCFEKDVREISWGFPYWSEE